MRHSIGYPRSRISGFTLVEMVVVIVIAGIIGGMVAMFMRAPVQGYVDSARRAELTDIADTALRRLARDMRTAVPNSVRVANFAGNNSYIEFLPTRSGGRYRLDASGGSGTVCGGVAGNRNGDALSFDAADSCFEIIGAPVSFGAGDQIVIGSTQSTGNPPYDGTATGVRRPYAGAAGAQSRVLVSGAAWPAYAQLPGQRFEVIPGDQQAVTYACIGTLGALDANGDGQAKLMRFWNYGYNAVQVAPPLAGSSAMLADKVSACEIAYGAINQRTGLFTMRLGITRGNEGIMLYHEVHIHNVP